MDVVKREREEFSKRVNDYYICLWIISSFKFFCKVVCVCLRGYRVIFFCCKDDRDGFDLFFCFYCCFILYYFSGIWIFLKIKGNIECFVMVIIVW